MFGTKNNKAHQNSDLEQQKAALEAQIRELESFIELEPKKLQQEHQDSLQTMPAPDEITQRKRERVFSDRLSKGELKNEYRHQASGIFIFIILATCIVLTSIWIWRIFTESSPL